MSSIAVRVVPRFHIRLRNTFAKPRLVQVVEIGGIEMARQVTEHSRADRMRAVPHFWSWFLHMVVIREDAAGELGFQRGDFHRSTSEFILNSAASREFWELYFDDGVLSVRLQFSAVAVYGSLSVGLARDVK